MTLMEFFAAIRHYRADVLLLALGVSLLTSLLKRTVFKRLSKRFYVFLPFALGIVLYTVYSLLTAWSVAPLTQDAYATLEGGFGCGCAATLYYCVYKQFFRKGEVSADPLAPLLEPVVPAETIAEAGALLLAGRDADDLPAFVKETLRPYAFPSLTEFELEVHAQLIAKYLQELGKA